MNIVRECRYMYFVPRGHRDYPDGHYGALMAINMADARSHLARWCRGAKIVRANLGIEMCGFVDIADQPVRKAIFDGARTLADLDAVMPSWREDNSEYLFHFDK